VARAQLDLEIAVNEHACDLKRPKDGLGFGCVWATLVHRLSINPKRTKQSCLQGPSDDDRPFSIWEWVSVCWWVTAWIHQRLNDFHRKEQTPTGSPEIA